MNHLKVIKYIDYLSAAVLIVGGLITVGSTGATVWVIAKATPDALFVAMPVMGVTAAVALLLFGMAMFALLVTQVPCSLC